MNGGVQWWPVAMGWMVVSLLALLGFRRQALIAAAGMTVVSLAVWSVSMGT